MMSDERRKVFNTSFIIHTSSFHFWRKGWDSNPRNPFEVHSISNAANSTALAPFPNDELGITNAEQFNFSLIIPNSSFHFRRNGRNHIVFVTG